MKKINNKNIEYFNTHSNKALAAGEKEKVDMDDFRNFFNNMYSNNILQTIALKKEKKFNKSTKKLLHCILSKFGNININSLTNMSSEKLQKIILHQLLEGRSLININDYYIHNSVAQKIHKYLLEFQSKIPYLNLVNINTYLYNLGKPMLTRQEMTNYIESNYENMLLA